MGLLRTSEESRPLVLNTSSPTSGSLRTISDGYVNEGICDPDKIISSKFGDSCRRSLTSILDKSAYKDSCEFELKKHFLRETSSGKYHLRGALYNQVIRNWMLFSFNFLQPIPVRKYSIQCSDALKGLVWSNRMNWKAPPGFRRAYRVKFLWKCWVDRVRELFLFGRVAQNQDVLHCHCEYHRQRQKLHITWYWGHHVDTKSRWVFEQKNYLMSLLPVNRFNTIGLFHFMLKGFTKEFPSLRALITHHSVMPERLPIPLALPRPQNIVPQRRHHDDFDTYGSLTDFRKMMSDSNG